jgi:hypothetical protein
LRTPESAHPFGLSLSQPPFCLCQSKKEEGFDRLGPNGRAVIPAQQNRLWVIGCDPIADAVPARIFYQRASGSTLRRHLCGPPRLRVHKKGPASLRGLFLRAGEA